jgi:hypothetical protein
VSIAAPDFNRATVETLAKRAAFKCSNPDCRVATVGPNSDPTKATVIGEAAHILGARQNAKRHDPDMSDSARAEITNAIWLCRNCHKLVDSDAERYESSVLFAWRERHEEFVLLELGSATDKIRLEQQSSQLAQFAGYPPMVRRIVLDKPPGWEYRLTAALTRHLNAPHFRTLRDLRDGLYIKSYRRLDDAEAVDWVQDRFANFSAMVAPITNLLAQLNRSWGEPGQPGDVDEIHHVCRLIAEYLRQAVIIEEETHFIELPEKFGRLHDLLKDVMGAQARKLAEIPASMDEVVACIDARSASGDQTPRTIQKTIVFELPDDWSSKVNRELRRVQSPDTTGGGLGFWSIIFVVLR